MKMELEKNKISAENVRNTLEKMHDYHKNSEKVEFKMKPQTPLTNMVGRWVHSTKEAFDALVEMKYGQLYDDGYLDFPYIEVLKYRNDKGIKIYQTDVLEKNSKQAYYHKGHFYDEPYEEFTITEEKAPFPELEDIEWVMVESHIARKMGSYLSVQLWDMLDTEMPIKVLSNEEIELFKTLYENSKDFKVTWKMKEKPTIKCSLCGHIWKGSTACGAKKAKGSYCSIKCAKLADAQCVDRRLHENRPLALAIGKMMLEEGNCIDVISVGYSKKVILHAVSGGYTFNLYYPDSGKIEWSDYATLPDDYIIQEKVLQWMKEYQEQ